MQFSLPIVLQERPAADLSSFRVLIACEFSGVVRRAFSNAGFDAWSCDLLPAEDRSNKHLVWDATTILDDGWDLLVVAHLPCTRLCKSGLRWLHSPPAGKTLEQMWADLDQAADLFSAFWNVPVPRIAVENPLMHRYAQQRIRGYRPPAQVVQPWQHGHGETKATCLWLKGLPTIQPTNVGEGREARVHRMSQTADRWRGRSRTFDAIASAMATQWGEYMLRELEMAS